MYGTSLPLLVWGLDSLLVLRVTLDRILQVQKVESALRSVGCVQFRARWHQIDDQAMVQIELGNAEMELMLNPVIRDTINDVATSVGFRWVTLDLQGYRKGNGSLKEDGTHP